MSAKHPAFAMFRCEVRSLLTDHVLEKFLSKGAFGSVSQCRNVHSNHMRAIKLIMPHGGLVGKEFKAAVRETNLQQRLGASQDICKIYSWITFAGAIKASPPESRLRVTLPTDVDVQMNFYVSSWNIARRARS